MTNVVHYIKERQWIYEVLERLHISYNEISHEPVFTIEQAKSIESEIQGIGCKNLFLTDKKGRYFLVILEETKRANIKELSALAGTTRLSFAKDEDLEKMLQLHQGSVTPLGIINDYDNKVLLIIDKDLQGQRLLVHPNINTKTISIGFEDLIRFIEYEKHSYIFVQ